ncbi:hypothetical protein AAE02nite_36420 [Adhaeribacter aerolatus]|uniref:Uncharacterized protein n=1 Tax=Adhaeribacter aerolatus TaxID=670289 RepID=A0A512B1X6_9BACT|nr:hypothetical protein [Adhaeribacter aerolatus]GEO05978.1 hypothetical protein AAE02nite_36420 [Adhaeribacter aerolatus]
MAPVKNSERRVRVIESNTDYEEMQAGHIIPGADPPKNDHARGGFGDRDGRNGFGTDTGDGATAISINEDTADPNGHTDGLQISSQLNARTAVTSKLGDDDDLDEEDDLDDVDVDDISDDDIDDTDFDDTDFDDDLDDDLDLDEDLDEDEDDDL